jgi:hypothetical protein
MNPDEVAKTAIKLIEAFGYSQDDLSIDARWQEILDLRWVITSTRLGLRLRFRAGG